MELEKRDLEPVDFDPNVWWQMSEERVDTYDNDKFTSSFSSNEKDALGVWPANAHYWQLQPVDETKGRYALRQSKSGVFKQLSVCHNADEIANSRTQPCMADSDASDEQKWDVADWGNSTYRFVNVANGTDYVLDCHPGNPPFLSDEPGTDFRQPAQRWLLTSVKNVDDGAYSTVFTQSEATITSDGTVRTVPAGATGTASSSSSGDSGSDGLSAGAAAGVGIGAALGIIALALLGFFVWWRRRRNRQHPAAIELDSGSGLGPEKPPYSSPSFMAAVPPASSHAYHTSHIPPGPAPAVPTAAVWPPSQYRNPPSAYEMPADHPAREAPSHFRSELDATPVGGSQITSFQKDTMG